MTMASRRPSRVSRSVLAVAGRTLAYLVMGTFALMTVFPILWLIINSFKSTPEYRVNMIGLPRKWNGR